ncbi:hypothetical protein BG74_02395 [Sodalis-like endosymbiont of Proechinophthirus fluctus]|nr:hypothetical protein BG74_02395 [Sodalis-like endosymbiont of Proechinophthirus fluctus]
MDRGIILPVALPRIAMPTGTLRVAFHLRQVTHKRSTPKPRHNTIVNKKGLPAVFIDYCQVIH